MHTRLSPANTVPLFLALVKVVMESRIVSQSCLLHSILLTSTGPVRSSHQQLCYFPPPPKSSTSWSVLAGSTNVVEMQVGDEEPTPPSWITSKSLPHILPPTHDLTTNRHQSRWQVCSLRPPAGGILVLHADIKFISMGNVWTFQSHDFSSVR